MEKIELEIYSQESNMAIVRMPGRRFPGMVIQGDSFSTLHGLAKLILGQARLTGNTELIDEARELTKLLTDRLKLYESVLQKHGMELPYIPIELE